MRRGGAPSRLRRLNSADVLAALYAQGPRTLSEVSWVTGLSRPTVEDVVEDFVRHRVVRELPPEPGGAGRPARRFRFDADEGFAAGIDIGVHKILVILTNLEGEVRHVARAPAGPDLDGPERLAVTRHTLERCLSESGVSRDRLRAIAAARSGTPGPRPPWRRSPRISRLGPPRCCWRSTPRWWSWEAVSPAPATSSSGGYENALQSSACTPLRSRPPRWATRR
jgi:hypothetical protein